eukprot:jgi/Bigna1/76604/fgenesh1_pg.42_\
MRGKQHCHRTDISSHQQSILNRSLVIVERTFEEAHDLTGMVPNIVVTSRDGIHHSMVCNFLSTPNVLVWSAALCSCALPGMYKPATLYAKNRDGKIVKYDESDVQWIDGSIASDIPTERLAQLFNVRYRIVSQVNPHVVSFLEGRRSWWPQRLLVRSIQYLARELREVYLGLTTLGILPNHKYISQLMEQGYSGDCTIRPKVGLTEFLKLFKNPTKWQSRSLFAQRSYIELKRMLQEQFEYCMAKGQGEAWKYIGEILAHSNLERVLDGCVQELYKKAQIEPVASGSSQRISGKAQNNSHNLLMDSAQEMKKSDLGERRLSWSVEEFISARLVGAPNHGVIGYGMKPSATTLSSSRSLADIRICRMKRSHSTDSI